MRTDDETGDDMIRKLADRLVSVDLLDRAGDLLNHQVRERLEGEDKSRVGMRLAMIHLCLPILCGVFIGVISNIFK